MTGFVVVVVFSIEDGTCKQFLAAVLENAAASLSNEPRCRTFEVSINYEASQVLLYEIYDTEEAFHLHLKTEHFNYFDSVSAEWILDKKVTTYQLLS